MEKGEKGRFYKLRWMWNILRHGLFLKGLNNRLGRTGFDLMLYYYWFSELEGEIQSPEIRGDASGFTVSRLDLEDVNLVQTMISGLGDKDFAGYFQEGQICVGVKHLGQIAAYVFIQTSDLHFRDRVFKMNANEAYLHSMYTFESYRGKNLGAFLACECYRLCKDMGINKVYGISDYLNKSSLRLRDKLKAENKALYLSVDLFKKKRKTVMLKAY